MMFACALPFSPVPDSQLSPNVGLLNRDPQTWTGAQTIFGDNKALTFDPNDTVEHQQFRARASGSAGNETFVLEAYDGNVDGSNTWFPFVRVTMLGGIFFSTELLSPTVGGGSQGSLTLTSDGNFYWTLPFSGSAFNMGPQNSASGADTEAALTAGTSVGANVLLRAIDSASAAPVTNGVTGSQVVLQSQGGAYPITFAVSGTSQMRLTSTELVMQQPIRTQAYTVAGLPTGTEGMRAHVTNALAPVFGSTVAGGGTVKVPVFYNGANWIVG